MRARTPKQSKDELVAKIRKSMTRIGLNWAYCDVYELIMRIKDESENTQTVKRRRRVRSSV